MLSPWRPTRGPSPSPEKGRDAAVRGGPWAVRVAAGLYPSGRLKEEGLEQEATHRHGGRQDRREQAPRRGRDRNGSGSDHEPGQKGGASAAPRLRYVRAPREVCTHREKSPY